MPDIQTLSKYALLPIAALFSIFILHWQPNITSDILWSSLPFILLPISAILAWQFKRSRLAILSIVLLTPLLFPLTSLTDATTITLCQIFACAILTCEKDRGVTSSHGIKQILAISLWAVLFWLITPIINSTFDPWMIAHFPSLNRMPIPLWQFILVCACFASILSYFLLHPCHAQGAFLLTASILALPLLIELSINHAIVLSLLAGTCIFAVLLDTYFMAYRDDLTGLPSRRALNQYAHTLGREYCVCMLDIDHFKSFNDTYGHDVGDQVLKLVAAKIGAVRGGGKAFRYGGEEFTIVFPKHDRKAVKPHLEDVRQIIADYKIVLRDFDRKIRSNKSRGKKSSERKRTVSVTISLGVAQRKEMETYEEVMKRADKALYRAKKGGRNRLNF